LETYANKDITPDSDLSKIEPPLMKDLQDVLEGMVGAEELTERLKKYTEGTFSGLFNSPTNVEIDKELVVFSVRDLEDELRAIGISMIISYIWNVVRSKMKKRILVIDESSAAANIISG
jgi:conjugal transfer ATP-binding protein TraC